MNLNPVSYKRHRFPASVAANAVSLYFQFPLSLRMVEEVTFQEARAHLGVETQRQWSDRAVARTTPCLFGLFSLVTLLAAQLDQRTRTGVLIDSWYRKSHPIIAYALATVRRQIWRETGLFASRQPAWRQAHGCDCSPCTFGT
jgi:lambda repressor-like predicted transcriptional regulator